MIRKIFTQNTEVPDIVQKKVDDALARIKTEEKNHMAEKRKIQEFPNRNGMFKRGTAAAAFLGVFTAFGITAVAAAGYYYYWSRGMQGALQATEEQQQSLTEQGVATILRQPENNAETSMAVTDAGITITPMEIIVDGQFAYLSFSVEGYDIGAEEEPGFESVGEYLGDDPEAESGWLNRNGSFYDGIVVNEYGKAVYDDGTPLKETESGATQLRYIAEDGTLSYVMMVYSPEQNENLVGKTIHVSFKNLGVCNKASYENRIDGRWDFTIPLSGQNAAKTYSLGKQVGDTIFTIDSIELSPISAKVNYSVDGTPQIHEDEIGVPLFQGVIYKDGTKLPYLANGGQTGYTDEKMRCAYDCKAFNRVIDVEQVKSLLFRMEGKEEMIEIALP